MTARTAEQKGHLPTLVASFLHFDLSFMLWVLPGALGVFIAASLHLSTSEKALVVAVPILSGSLLRMPLGLLSDRVGAKRVGQAMLAVLYLPLTLGWLAGHSLASWLAIGLLLGTAGASFAVALPLASRWYPAERQGLVMGIAAAGNSGTVIANLLAPRLANMVGWQNVLGLAMLPLSLVFVAFSLAAKDSPATRTERASESAEPLIRQPDLWWFCLIYSVTFGGYVGLSSFFPIFLRDQYGVSAVTAGYLTAVVAFCGSVVRPLGGHLADRLGGLRMLSALLLGISAAYLLVATLPPLALLMPVASIGVACLGMGNGAVFQLVPRRFQPRIGVATGIIGACGGIGGFLLPNLLANAKALSGSFGPGFVVLAVCAFAAFLMLRALALIHEHWRVSWRGREARSAGPMAAAPVRVLMAPNLM